MDINPLQGYATATAHPEACKKSSPGSSAFDSLLKSLGGKPAASTQQAAAELLRIEK